MNNSELLSYIKKIQDIMTAVSTGVIRIQEKENDYKELYYKIAVELDKRDWVNKNDYSSLWDFYSYWRKKLPSYQDRREYIRYLYKELTDHLYINKIKPEENPSLKNNKVIEEFSFSIEDLHEDILLKCKDHFLNKKYDDAILNALKLIEDRVREKGKYEDSDIGVKLMQKAFNPSRTPFSIADNKGEIAGWMNLYQGVIGALKNPQSHRFVDLDNPFETFQILVFASYLLSFVDNLQFKESEIEDLPV